ncbi:MAG: RNA polymerase sigma factor [Salinibacter sp.]|uniref:RNA polymerase sigma factor n=1 Tax=Salinibacter sp. TaxID=2065818 RepID=UPI0035D45B50
MPTDKQLRVWCRRIKASDREAFASVFDVLHDRLARYALQITGRKATARDVVQQAFTALWEMRSSLNPEESLEALLFRIVRNRAYNCKRDRQTRASNHEILQRDTEPIRDTPAVDMDADRLEKHLRSWIVDLPERQQEALVLSRFEGLTHEEIGEVMEISPATVNTHIVRALKTLRRKVRSHHPDLQMP